MALLILFVLVYMAFLLREFVRGVKVMTYEELQAQEMAAQLKRTQEELNLALGFINWQGLDSAWTVWKEGAGNDEIR